MTKPGFFNFNKVNTYDWFKENLTKLSDVEDYDHTNRNKAMQILMEHNGLVTGLIYHEEDTPSYQDKIPGYKTTPLSEDNLELDREKFERLVNEFM